MSLSSVKLGTSFNKKYTHNLDFDNNGQHGDVVTEQDMNNSTLDTDNMFDDFDDFDE